MFKLLTITVAVAALSACTPAVTIAPFDRQEADVPGECVPAREGECSEPVTPVPPDPNAPCVPEGGMPCLEGGLPIPPPTGSECPTAESCATPTPGPPVPPDLTSAECEGLSAEECANRPPQPPSPPLPPAPGSAEGGG